jgi:SRSO17 transposase
MGVLGMDLASIGDCEARFSAYVDELATVMGHADREGPLRDYCMGLLLPGERKSVEPMAAITAPARTAAQHQSLLHFVGESRWLDDDLLTKVREMVQPAIERGGAIEAWIVDDTGFPKKGKHSVGVARQYCGQLGKQDNCQVAVSLSIANHHASLPIAYRLYLPREWAEDIARRRKARVPAEIEFKTKPDIALEQIHAAREAGVPIGVVLIDAGYGASTELRTGITSLGLTYVAGILPQTKVWATLPNRQKASGRASSNGKRRKPKRQRISVKELATRLPKSAWKKITWREGSADSLSSRFARVRVCAAPQGDKISSLSDRSDEWVLIEWPKSEPEPTKYWLSTLPDNTSFQQLVDFTKLRWRIERDYQELKQEVGLGHYEGRGWPGFHHHASLCIAAYGFLVSERETIPPSGPSPRPIFAQPTIPANYRPRGAANPPRTSHP